MPGRQNDTQLIAHKAHSRLTTPGFREKFGLPRMGKADLLQPVLAHRTGHHTAIAALDTAPGGLLQGQQRKLGAFTRWHASFEQAPFGTHCLIGNTQVLAKRPNPLPGTNETTITSH